MIIHNLFWETVEITCKTKPEYNQSFTRGYVDFKDGNIEISKETYPYNSALYIKATITKMTLEGFEATAKQTLLLLESSKC
jgi:hypothetical protein